MTRGKATVTKAWLRLFLIIEKNGSRKSAIQWQMIVGAKRCFTYQDVPLEPCAALTNNLKVRLIIKEQVHGNYKNKEQYG